VLTLDEAKKAATRAVARLEGIEFTWSGDRHHDAMYRGQVAYESRSRSGVSAPVDDFDDEGEEPPTIFDE
jgi:hypothetical protein